MLREDAKKKLNMTGEVKYESRCNLDFFQKSDKVSALIFDIVNIGLHFFLKNVRPYAASCSEA